MNVDRSLLRQLDPQRIHGIVNKPVDAEIKSRSSFEKMATSAMIAGGPFLAWLNRLG